MRFVGSVASWFVGLGLVVGSAIAQDVRIVERSLVSGDADVGAALTGRLEGSRWTVTVPGLAYQPTQLNARAYTSATPRLFGASRQAVYTDGQSRYLEGTWRVDPVTGAVTTFVPYSPPNILAGGFLRVAGQTIFSTTTSPRLVFDRVATLPLLSVSSPSFGVGGISVHVACQVTATAQYRGDMLVQPRTPTTLPSVRLVAQGHGYYATSARLVNESGFGSTSLSSAIQNGNTHIDAYAFVSPLSRSGRLILSIDAVRLYLRACLNVGWISVCRTLCDKAFPAISGLGTL